MVEVGEKIPDAELIDTEMKAFRLSELKGSNAIILFYPGAFTSVCTDEFCTLRDMSSALNETKARAVGISVDSPFSNKAFKEKSGVSFPLLSDYERKAIRSFGIELHDFADMKGYIAAKRSAFIVDKDGIVKYAWISDDPTVEPDYNVLIAELKKLG